MKPRKVILFAMLVTMLPALTMLASARSGSAANTNFMNANISSGITGQAVDMPYGEITICIPGTTQCQFVGKLLIDTGSYGLRIFSQALTIALPVQMSGSDKIAECAQFGSFTAWGRIGAADVIMGGEAKIHNLPLQIINNNFPAAGVRPAGCNDGLPFAQNPQQMEFKGILGVGLIQSDCPICVSTTPAGGYYACTSSSCSPITEPLDQQVQNPVALLPVDNNGVMLKFPLPPTNGASTLTGQLFFGVNTESNNQIPDTYKIYTADPTSLTFSTRYQNQSIPSFIDSGSNGYFYDNPYLTVCPGGSSPWYCPAELTAQHAYNSGSDGDTQNVEFNFAIANANDLFDTGNTAFYDLGANLGNGQIFDWGLPFFLGRRVFVGIGGMTITGVSESTPLWAYN
jgi:hypothetical protein